MKKKLILFSAVLVLLMFTAVDIFAQAGFKVRIKSNVNGANVYVNNLMVGKTPATVYLPPGPHQIRVSAPGYRDANKVIKVFKNLVFFMTLEAMQIQPPTPGKFKLRLKSNVKGAQVYVDGQYSGKTPATIYLRGGTYNIRVTAYGYSDFTRTINISNHVTMFASLQQNVSYYYLDINSNVQKARVFINGVERGRTPLCIKLRDGNYSIRVVKNGYKDFNANVFMNGNKDIFAKLKHFRARISIVIPPEITNGSLNQILVFVDGKRRKKFNFSVSPGEHRIRIVSGGFAVETVEYFEANRHYQITPNLYLEVN